MRREEGEWMKQSLSRSSNPQLFYKNAVISLNSQENTSAGVFFLNKFVHYRRTTLLNETPVQVLSGEFCKFYRNTFSREMVAVTASECIMNQS